MAIHFCCPQPRPGFSVSIPTRLHSQMHNHKTKQSGTLLIEAHGSPVVLIGAAVYVEISLCACSGVGTRLESLHCSVPGFPFRDDLVDILFAGPPMDNNVVASLWLRTWASLLGQFPLTFRHILASLSILYCLSPLARDDLGNRTVKL